MQISNLQPRIISALLFSILFCVRVQSQTQTDIVLYPPISNSEMHFDGYIKSSFFTYEDPVYFEIRDTLIIDPLSFKSVKNWSAQFSKSNPNFGIIRDSLFVAIPIQVEVKSRYGEVIDYDSIFGIYAKGKNQVYTFNQMISGYSGQFYRSVNTEGYEYSSESGALDVYRSYRDPIYTQYTSDEIKSYFGTYLEEVDFYKLSNYVHTPDLCETFDDSTIYELMITNYEIGDKPNEIIATINFGSSPCLYNDESFEAIFRVVHTFPIPRFYLTKINATDSYEWFIDESSNKKVCRTILE